jgi:hypothetical protein
MASAQRAELYRDQISQPHTPTDPQPELAAAVLNAIPLLFIIESALHAPTPEFLLK